MSQHNPNSTNFRSSYSSSRRGPSSDYDPILRQYSSDHSKPQRLPSQYSSTFKNHPRHPQPTSIPEDPSKLPTRRQNHVINNLRSELQNIKSEVAKLMSHDSPIKMRLGGDSVFGNSPNERVGMEGGYNGRVGVERFGDNSSTSSFMLSKDKLRTRMSTEGMDKERYHELGNEIIKTELKNLKNKYVLRKNEFKEEKLTLEKKILLLEEVIAHNQQQMAQYKMEIENQIMIIRQDMAGRVGMLMGQEQIGNHPRLNVLENENNEMRQEILYLRKRTSQGNDEIKRMAIQCNDLKNQLKRSRLGDNQADLWKQKEIQRQKQRQKLVNETKLVQQRIKSQYSQQIQQLERSIHDRDQYIKQILERQNIANQVVIKNAQLIELLNRERARSNQLQSELHRVNQGQNNSVVSKSELDIVSTISSNCSSNKYTELQNSLNNMRKQTQMLQHQNNNFERDLKELSHVMNNLKMQNQQLRSKTTSKIKPEQPILKQFADHEIQELRARNQQLETQANDIKGYINGLVIQTAQKMNAMEMQDNILKDKIIQLEQENRGLRSGRVASEESSFVKKMGTEGDEDKKSRRLDELQSWKVTLQQTISAKQRQISSLKNQLKKFTQVYTNKCKQIQQLHTHYSNQFSIQSSKQSHLNSMLNDLTMKMTQSASAYNQTINELRQEIDTISSTYKPQEEIEQLRELLNNQIEQLQRLRQNCTSYQYALNSSKTTIQSQKLKLSTQFKTIQASYQIQLKTLRQQLYLTIKTSDSLFIKVQTLSDQLRKKDEFLNEFVNDNFDLGDRERIEEMIKKYQKICEVDGIRERLGLQIKEIERLTEENVWLMGNVTRLEQGKQRQK